MLVERNYFFLDKIICNLSNTRVFVGSTTGRSVSVTLMGDSTSARAQLRTLREPGPWSRMFPFLAWFYFLPRRGKALVDNCGLTL